MNEILIGNSTDYEVISNLMNALVHTVSNRVGVSDVTERFGMNETQAADVLLLAELFNGAIARGMTPKLAQKIIENNGNL